MPFTLAEDYITVSVVKPQGSVSIMISLSPLSIYRKSIMPGFYMLIQMPTTVTVFNGHFMMTLVFALCPFMKQEDICSLERSILMNEDKVLDMDILLIFLLMPLPKMSHGCTSIDKLSTK